MTLTQLQYIIALNRYRSFSLAAEKCSVTQPTLSIQIQKLEQELGIILFDRSKHPVLPTQAGKAIVLQSQKVWEETKRLKHLAQNIGDVVQGHLRIAIHPSLAPYLMPLLLPRFTKAHPNVAVSVRELHNYQLLPRIQQDRADVGITVSPVNLAGFYEIPLFKEPIAVYVSSKHPLTAKKRLAITDVNLKELLLTDDGQGMGDTIAHIQQQSNKTVAVYKGETSLPKVQYRSGSVETMLKIIEKVGGMTLLPKLATYYMGKRQTQQVRYFANPQPKRQVVMLVQRGFEKQRLVDALHTAVKQCLPNNFDKT